MSATLTHSFIEASKVSKQVKTGESTLTILNEVDLVINSGETVAIVGVSGAGKSTLLGLLAGLDLPSSGEIYFNQQALSRLDEDGRAALRAAEVSFIFQNFQLLPSLTALENVMLPLELNKKSAARDTAKNWLQRVGLNQRDHHYPRQLSGGEQQRVAIARAFAVEPKILFADEPTGNLDEYTGQQIIDLLFGLNISSGTTLVVVTHDEHLAKRCQRTITLVAGRVMNPL